MATYAHPEVLVETDWVKQNLDKPSIKIVEIDVDTLSGIERGEHRPSESVLLLLISHFDIREDEAERTEAEE